jgi:hypothetical protein
MAWRRSISLHTDWVPCPDLSSSAREGGGWTSSSAGVDGRWSSSRSRGRRPCPPRSPEDLRLPWRRPSSPPPPRPRPRSTRFLADAEQLLEARRSSGSAATSGAGGMAGGGGGELLGSDCSGNKLQRPDARRVGRACCEPLCFACGSPSLSSTQQGYMKVKMGVLAADSISYYSNR